MASFGACSGGACSVRRHAAVFLSKSAAARPSSLSMAPLRVKAAIKISRSESGESRAVSGDKIDEWMRDSVVEIVKTLPQAPLLVHVYPKSCGPQVELRTQRAVGEADWKAATVSWEKRESPLPEGVIFVEELRDHDVDQEEGGGANSVDRAWGIVVQGRGSEYGGGGGSACYLLKTSCVGSGFGLCSTHFCLTRVKSFREKTKTQFKNCWLLNPMN